MDYYNLQEILDSGKIDQSIVDAVKRLKLAIEDVINLQTELEKKLEQIYTSGPIQGDGTQQNPLTVHLPPIIGDMQKSVYDSDDDGIVNDSERLGGKLPNEYATATHTHLVEQITNFTSGVLAIQEIQNAINKAHEHPNKALLDALTNSGDGSQYFGDDGKFHPLPSPGGGDGGGDMTMDVYDSNRNGIVDDAERLGGKLPNEFAPSAHTHTSTQITDFNTAVENNPTVQNLVSAKHTHSNKALLDVLTNSGDGTKALMDNGTYVVVLQTVAVDGTTIAGDGTPGNPLRVIGGGGNDTIDGNDGSTTLDGGDAYSSGTEIIDGGAANG